MTDTERTQTSRRAAARKRTAKDRSEGGKRSAMARGEDPGDGPTRESWPEERARQLSAEQLAEIQDQYEAEAPRGQLARGIEVLLKALKTLPGAPGVYRMLDKRGDALYVGKANNLKKRVTSYTQVSRLPHRLQRMVAATADLEVVTTHTETEALLLESNLIKRLMPRFNVLLRDDKSFPYILIAEDHEFPQIVKHRGARTRPGAYFGPFASAGAVNRTVTALEKAFLLRSCSDGVFTTRTRPCLMYQIKRCAAPCVGRVGKADYDELVLQAKNFLTGRSQGVQQRLAADMQAASDRQDYEVAAVYRDRIRALTQVQSRQDINLEGLDDADVIAAHHAAGETSIQVFFFRAGRNYGNRAYFPRHDKALGVEEVLSAFVPQFYDNKPVPKQILLSHTLSDQKLIAEALSERAGRRITLLRPARGAKRKLVEHALSNARDALARRLAESSAQRQLLEDLSTRLKLDSVPERIEVYDNSHIQGGDPYGAMIVAGPDGFIKSAYRKFRIKEALNPDGGDDYAMMREVMRRRFSRALKEDPDRSGDQWPGLLLIDGGRGQLSSVREVLADLGLSDIPAVGIAKGPDRNAGREQIFLPDRDQPILLEPRDPVLYFLQRLRDEAHRFVIGSHRVGRTKSRLRSVLDEVPGVGGKRKKALLHHFGSAQAVARAGLADLESVEGINKVVAKKIYDHFHADG
jgi:excinuclease ABC subunit C